MASLKIEGILQTLMIVYSCLAKEKHHHVYITMRRALCTFVCLCTY